MDYTVRLTWTEGSKGTIFSRTFHTTIDANKWGRGELLPYGIGYSIERVK